MLDGFMHLHHQRNQVTIKHKCTIQNQRNKTSEVQEFCISLYKTIFLDNDVHQLQLHTYKIGIWKIWALLHKKFKIKQNI